VRAVPEAVERGVFGDEVVDVNFWSALASILLCAFGIG